MICFGVLAVTAGAVQQVRSEVSATELGGFADIHVHQMANLGFGGSIVWGCAGGDPRGLGAIPAPMRRGHDAVEGATHGHFVAELARTLINVLLGDWFQHGEEGFPSFRSWPGVNRWTHQQVYKAWLCRAYQGGLRLIVMLAVNSEDQFGRGEDEIPLVRYHAVQKVKAPGRTGNDMESLDWQIRAAYQLQAEIDYENGGTGMGWYRIVRDPDEAAKVISDGKLAVILGTELQHLFNCDTDRPACSPDTVIEGLNRLEEMGVNYVFPVHHKLNQFGGAAKFSFANNGPSGPCPDHQPRYEHTCSAVGLSKLGEFLIEELSARGMLIDTEHMGWRSFDDTMKIVERRNYPVLAGHVVPFDLAVATNKSDRNERAKTKEQIRRIINVGGIVAPMLGTAAGPYVRGGQPPIPIHCRTTDGGGVDQWANAYLFMRDVAGTKAVESGRISLGSDWNGFAGWPGPRGACAPKDERRVTYPFPLPAGLKPAAIQPVSEMTLYE
jgi:microsomal dipeptidase-like Zn-dependent dipeptidase